MGPSETVGPTEVFGRKDEIDAIDWLIEGATAGSGRVLVLEGEAGIGKTHLAQAARERAALCGAAVLAGGADDLERDRPGRLLFLLGERLGLDLPALLRGAPEQGFAVIEALIDAIAERAVTRPVVVVAEDLHWADELSLRGLITLIRGTGPLAIGVLATMRQSPRPQLLQRLLDEADRVPSRHMRITGLDETALAALVNAECGAPPGSDLVKRLKAASGNPLYAVELLRALADEGLLRVKDGATEASTHHLPTGLRDTLVRRLSALPPECNEALRLASLLGSEFTLNDLATISGRSVVVVAAQLADAVEASILTGQGDTLAFRHDLIREAVYESIAPAIRRDLHGHAARSLAEVGAQTPKVARHFTLGARRGDAEAAAWLARAARDAVGLSPSSAVSLFERALEVAPDSWDERVATEIARLEPLALAGRVDDARHAVNHLLAGATEGSVQFEIHAAAVTVFRCVGDLGSASLHAASAAAIDGAPVEQTRILRCLALGERLLLGASPADVIAATEADIQRGGSEHLRCVAHQTLAIAAGAEARYDDAFEHAREARRRFDHGTMSRMGFLIPDIWEGTFYLSTDRAVEAARVFDTAGRDAERRGELILLVHTNLGTAGVDFHAGRWDDAVRNLEGGLAVADETGAHAQLVTTHGLLARIALGRGDRSTARAHLTAGQTALEAGMHLFGVDVLMWARAAVLEADREHEAALQVLAGLWTRTETLRGLLQYHLIAPDLVRLATRLGDSGLANAVADETAVLATRSTVLSASAVAHRCAGLAAQDAEQLMAAVAEYRLTPRRVELAACCEETAGLLIAAGRIDEAIALLNEAAAIHIGSRATAELARVDATLRVHGRRRRRSGAAPSDRGWAALSPKEREVVNLVAQGLSNPHIGDRLYISRRTVETHLAHVFRKLDITNRAELAVAAVASRPDAGTVPN